MCSTSSTKRASSTAPRTCAASSRPTMASRSSGYRGRSSTRLRRTCVTMSPSSSHPVPRSWVLTQPFAARSRHSVATRCSTPFPCSSLLRSLPGHGPHCVRRAQTSTSSATRLPRSVRSRAVGPNDLSGSWVATLRRWCSARSRSCCCWRRSATSGWRSTRHGTRILRGSQGPC